MLHLLLAIIYLSFISLGLPDGLLGAAWPTMYPALAVPVSYAGIVSMIIALGTIVSSLMSDRLTYALGTGKVTAISVAMTAAALFGFSLADSFWLLCLWAIPYGLGAGSVDASLNNYVALHYTSRHMSWLHCMWGLGATIGPYIMGFVLTGGGHWSLGYRYVGILQVVLTAVLFLSLPMWKNRHSANPAEVKDEKPLPLAQVVKIRGAKEVMVSFFCYCALEQTAMLWASSYLFLYKGLPEETAAFFASLFFIGITAGRGLNGFLTMKFSDTQLIRMGQLLIGLGIVFMLLPLADIFALLGLVLIGLGCAPIYPCIIHSTPAHFGPERSQALIGVQMASAYTGSCLAPPVFGLLANHISAGLMPLYLLAILLLMIGMHEKLIRKVEPDNIHH
ncbi:MAG: MFS transporter [Oscillospiraceae bacterium]|nr:MFS transporter [Oscillospiraceae bacterium]